MRRLGIFGGFVIGMVGGSVVPVFAAVTLPDMRPGFWQNTVQVEMVMAGQPARDSGPPAVTFNCVDASTLADSMSKMSGGMPGCTFDMEGGPVKYSLVTKCVDLNGQPGTVMGQGTMVFAGNAAMHMTSSMVADMQGMHMTMSMVGDSKWVGSCPAGAKPGDYGDMEGGVFKKTDIGNPPSQ